MPVAVLAFQQSQGKKDLSRFRDTQAIVNKQDRPTFWVWYRTPLVPALRRQRQRQTVPPCTFFLNYEFSQIEPSQLPSKDASAQPKDLG